MVITEGIVRMVRNINIKIINLKFGVPNFVGLSLISLDLKSEIITVTINPAHIKKHSFIAEASALLNTSI